MTETTQISRQAPPGMFRVISRPLNPVEGHLDEDFVDYPDLNSAIENITDSEESDSKVSKAVPGFFYVYTIYDDHGNIIDPKGQSV